jgi:hypothetical protein
VGSHGGRLFGLSLADPAEPRLLWTVATAKPIFSSPAVDGLTGTVRWTRTTLPSRDLSRPHLFFWVCLRWSLAGVTK